jgi:hypothetical protein
VSQLEVPLERHGASASYAARVTFPGRYRVLAGWAPGPSITVGR